MADTIKRFVVRDNHPGALTGSGATNPQIRSGDLRGVSRDLAVSAGVLHRREKALAESEYIMKATTDFRTSVNDRYQELVKTMPEGGGQIGQNMDQFLQEKITEIANQAPSKEAQIAFQGRIDSLRQSFSNSARSVEAKEKARFHSSLAVEQLETSANILLDDPTQFVDSLENFELTVEDQFNNGLIDTETANKLKEQGGARLAENYIRGLIKTDPALAREELKDPLMNELLTPTQKIALEGSAKDKAFKVNQLARQKIESDMADNVVALSQGRPAPHDISLQRIASVYGTDQDTHLARAKQYQEDVNAAEMFSALKDTVKYMPLGAVGQPGTALDTLENTRQTNPSSEMQAVFDKVESQILQDERSFRADPVAWMLSSDQDARESLERAKESGDFSTYNRRLYVGQTSKGVPPTAVSFLAEAEASSLAGQVNELNGVEFEQFADQLVSRFSQTIQTEAGPVDVLQSVLGQLHNEAGINQLKMSALSYRNTRAFRVIANAADMSTQEFASLTEERTSSDFRRAFANELIPLVPRITGGTPDGENLRYVQNLQELGARLTGLHFSQGMSLKDARTRAMEEVVESIMYEPELGDRHMYMAPNSVNPDDLEELMGIIDSNIQNDRILDVVSGKEVDILPVESSNPALSPTIRREEMRTILRRGEYMWVTANNNHGIQLVVPDTSGNLIPVQKSDGQPFIVPWKLVGSANLIEYLNPPDPQNEPARRARPDVATP